MKEHPILFSGSMVRALLTGTKTQTRRVVKPQPDRVCPVLHLPRVLNKSGDGFDVQLSPYGQPGDRIWVRETHQFDAPCDGTWQHTSFYGCKGAPLDLIPERFRRPEFCLYRAGYAHDITWRPAIHMPRWASRITLEIVSVRVERLQDISEADAQAEGCSLECMTPTGEDSGSAIYGPSGYRALWESINGPGSWDANPWVWVVEFKRLTC